MTEYKIRYSGVVQDTYELEFIYNENLISDMEVWAPIEIVDGKYEVSTHGRIRHAVTKKIKNIADDNGYKRVCLFSIHYRVHRLVAMAFIPNPNNLPIINHKNNVKNDNRVENLEWCTYSYNVAYSMNDMTKSKISAALKGKPSPLKGKHWFKCPVTGKRQYY